MRGAWFSLAVAGLATADSVGCPFAGPPAKSTPVVADMTPPTSLPIYTNDTDSYMTTDWGTPIQDQLSLKVGPRGPTVLEDFMFRQKLQRFDHERVS
jgi:catalase